MSPKEAPINRDTIKVIANEEFGKSFAGVRAGYKKQMKAYAAGIAAVFLILTGSVFTPLNLPRLVHNFIFPPEDPKRVAVAYTSTFELSIDSTSNLPQKKEIIFYAIEGQRCELSLIIKPNDFDPEIVKNHRGVVVTVDNRSISLEPLLSGTIQWTPITDLLEYIKRDAIKINCSHVVGFELDGKKDNQIWDGTIVHCIITVYGV